MNGPDRPARVTGPNSGSNSSDKPQSVPANADHVGSAQQAQSTMAQEAMQPANAGTWQERNSVTGQASSQPATVTDNSAATSSGGSARQVAAPGIPGLDTHFGGGNEIPEDHQELLSQEAIPGFVGGGASAVMQARDAIIQGQLAEGTSSVTNMSITVGDNTLQGPVGFNSQGQYLVDPSAGKYRILPADDQSPNGYLQPYGRSDTQPLARVILFIALLLNPLPALADMYGNFPGHGSRAAWDKAAALIHQGNIVDSKGDHKAAITYYRQAQKLYADDPRVPYAIGLSLDEDGQPMLAEPYLRKSFGVQHHFDNAINLAIVLIEEKKFDEGKQMLEAAKILIRNEDDKKRWSNNVHWFEEMRSAHK